MADHNPQHGRRPHFNRGRRGPDRRGTDRRSPQPHTPAADQGGRETPRDGVDVEQIMREIRTRIAQRHGIDLSAQQIQELAARRLEAILEPRNIKPSLLEQLRKSAGSGPDLPPAPKVENYTFEETTLYETHRGILRFFRRLLNPILKLFFNPGPLVQALNLQARINADAIAREAERERRQSEWNALHYELIQRVVVEMSRISIEMQSLANRIESLSAKVDFNERRVRGLENVPATTRPQPRAQEAPVAAPVPAAEGGASVEAPANATPEAVPGDGQRRRRRRRRGRRSGGMVNDAAMATETPGTVDPEDIDTGEGPELDDDEPMTATTEGEAIEAAAMPSIHAPSVAPEPEEPSTPPPTPTALPVTAEPQAAEPPAPAVPAAPRDEPAAAAPADHADPGPVDR